MKESKIRDVYFRKYHTRVKKWIVLWNFCGKLRTVRSDHTGSCNVSIDL